MVNGPVDETQFTRFERVIRALKNPNSNLEKRVALLTGEKPSGPLVSRRPVSLFKTKEDRDAERAEAIKRAGPQPLTFAEKFLQPQDIFDELEGAKDDEQRYPGPYRVTGPAAGGKVLSFIDQARSQFDGGLPKAANPSIGLITDETKDAAQVSPTPVPIGTPETHTELAIEASSIPGVGTFKTVNVENEKPIPQFDPSKTSPEVFTKLQGIFTELTAIEDRIPDKPTPRPIDEVTADDLRMRELLTEIQPIADQLMPTSEVIELMQKKLPGMDQSTMDLMMLPFKIGLTGLTAFGKVLEGADRPFHALIRSRFDDDVRRLAADLRDQGMSTLEAAQIAYERKVPVWKQVLGDFIAPTLFLPFIGAPGTAAKIFGMGPVAAKSLAKLSGTSGLRSAKQLTEVSNRFIEARYGLLIENPNYIRPLSDVAGEVPLSDIARPLSRNIADAQRAELGITKAATGIEGVDPPGNLGGAIDVIPPENSSFFIAQLRDLRDVASHVVATDNAVIKWVGTKSGLQGINPSFLRHTRVGRLVTGYYRQKVAAGEAAEVAVAAALDVRAQRFTGRTSPVTPVNSDGFYGDTGKLWQDVFSEPDKFNLTANQRKYIDDYHQVIDEIEAERVANGLRARAKTNTPDGWFYTPRSVEELQGFDVLRRSDASLARKFDEATDGFNRGVKYSNNPRETLLFHVKSGYNEIIAKQLDDALVAHSVRPSKLVPVAITAASGVAVRAAASARSTLRRLIREQARLQILAKATKTRKAAKGVQTRAANKVAAINPEVIAAKAELDKAIKELKRVQNQYRNAITSAKNAVSAPGNLFGRASTDKIAIGIWRNKFFPKEDADNLKDAIGAVVAPKANIFAKGLERLGNTIRFLASVGDFAAPFIQGLPVLADNPVVWARATAMHYTAWFDPTVQSRFLRDHLTTYKKMARDGIPVGDPEFFAALEKGRGFSPGQLLELLPKGQTARGIAQQTGRQTFGRFQSSYSTFLGQSRALLYEALEDGWKGRSDELAAYLRNLTGGLDSRALGVGPSQAATESVWLAFSPRLLRSTFGLVGSALQPWTYRGRRSLKNLSVMVSGATGIYISTGLAMGRPWEEIVDGLDPTNGKKFLSYKFGDDYIGVGGQVRAITQFTAAMYSTLVPGGKPITDLLPWNIDIFENPVLAFYFSRGAPAVNIVSAIIEVGTGLDAAPYEVIDGPIDLAQFIGTSALPFAIQGMLEGDSGFATLAGLAGARTSPATPYNKRDEARRDEMRSRRDKNGIPLLAQDEIYTRDRWAALGQDIRNSIDESPALAPHIFDVKEAQRAQGDQYREYADKNEALSDLKTQRITAAATEFGPSPEFRKKFREIANELGTRKQQLRDDNGAALEFFDTLDPPTAEFDRAMDAYADAFDDPDIHDALGDIVFSALQENLAVVESDFGADMMERIRIHRARNDHPLEVEMDAAIMVLEPFWDVDDQIFGTEGFLAEQYAQWRRHPNENKRADQLDAMTASQKRRFEYLLGKRTDGRRKMRENGVDAQLIDALYAIWYGDSPIHRRNKRLVERNGFAGVIDYARRMMRDGN